MGCDEVKTIRFGRIRVVGGVERSGGGGCGGGGGGVGSDGKDMRVETRSGISSDAAGLRNSHAFRVGANISLC